VQERMHLGSVDFSTKVPRTHNEEKTVSPTNSFRITGHPHAKVGLDPYLTPYVKVNINGSKS
jgi:hypothetical protein